MRITYAVPAVAVLLLAPAVASAQRVPFFGAGGTALDPEISVVNSGELLDAQAVVSGDMKYVTLNMRPDSARLLALRDFTFAGSGVRQRQGFVGGNANGNGNGADGVNRAPAGGRDGDGARDRNRARARRARAEADEQPMPPPEPVGVLARPGMTLVGRLED
jgi:hypothetical protein